MQPSFPELDLGLVDPSFNPSDDPITSLNKAMAFLSATFASRFPQTNIQGVNRQGAAIQARVVKCYNYQENVILLDSVPNQRNPGIQHGLRKRSDDLDAFDSDCDDIPSAKAVLMANLSSYDSYVLSKVPFQDTNIENDMSYQSVQETQCSEQPFVDNDTEIDITNDSNIISYEQYLQETENPVVQSISSSTQQDALL
ncbi:hypothetical protein Tco_1050145 [Tanacetum coccineum]